MSGKKLIIIDGNAIVHRAFYALPVLTNKKKEVVNALYGFISFFLKTIKEHNPDFIAAAFDLAGPTFRHKKYKEYKAKRIKAPDELYSQIPKIKEFLASANVPVFEKQGYEADDIIGAIAKKAPSSIDVIIMTGDLDALQLVSKNIKVFSLRKGIKEGVLYDKEKVQERYDGLSPRNMVDFRALKGDPSDNIPGALGIGEKTAIKIIRHFSNIENLYSALESKKPLPSFLSPGMVIKIKQSKKNVFLSKNLSEIDCKTSVDFNLEYCRTKNGDKKNIIDFLEKHGFKSLVSRITEKENLALWSE